MSVEKLNQIMSEIDLSEKQCTYTLLSKWRDEKPLAGNTILLNCHLTKATLLLVELFLAAGAQLNVTCTDDLVCHLPIQQLIAEFGIYLSPNELANAEHQAHFDVVIDCGAYLANHLYPKKAFVELTHVELSRYTTTNCPVISVDSSIIKQIETTYGTGDGFVRAIDFTYAQQDQDFTTKQYMVFGYGKVGEGICSCLSHAGVPKNAITVIETNEQLLHAAKIKGYLSLNLKQHELITHQLKHKTHCAVTATGITHCISEHFNPTHFSNVELLANMGTYDEWGQAFHETRILHEKRPLNFMLEYPTKILYLDPIFSLLACATLDVIRQKTNTAFVIKKPETQTEKEILAIWLANHLGNHKDITQTWLNEKEKTPELMIT